MTSERGTGSETAPPRSYLYVPGDQWDRLAKGSSRGADALLLDLEDSVAPADKGRARANVARWIGGEGHSGEVWIRINAGAAASDIHEAITAPVTGVMVPAAEPDSIEAVSRLLSTKEDELGLPDRALQILPLIETASGLLAARELASRDRVPRLSLGRADLAAELRWSVDPEGPEFTILLIQLVLASAAEGIQAPVAPTSLVFTDVDALRESTERFSRLGFRGRTAIHPAQLDAIHAAFGSSPEEIERARHLVESFDALDGTGVMVGDDGTMVDLAVVRSAREILMRADRQADTHAN